MYNQKIIDRLNNLTYLKVLKNSNASAITKKNPYGDIVKFYAQINKNDVIQAISFKCTGCSYFTALSSYFCELAEGKTVDEALKIKEKDLVAFAKLDESKHHIYPLILGTFALLVKRYRKALEQGKVVPCEVAEATVAEEKKTKERKKVDINIGLKEVLVNTTKTTRSTKSITSQKKEEKVAKKVAEKEVKLGTVAEKSSKKVKKLATEGGVGKENLIKKSEKSIDVTESKTKRGSKVIAGVDTTIATDTKTNIIIDEKTGDRIKSIHLAVIKDHKDEDVVDKKINVPTVNTEEEVIVSNGIPVDDATSGTRVIVQTVEKKTRVQTLVKNGKTTEISGEKVSAMSLSADGEDAHRHIHSASNLSDMLNRLNSSKSKINSVEAHTATTITKSVNGKTIDKASTLTSFSSMRDSLHRIREGNATVTPATKTLPTVEKETKKPKKNTTSKENKKQMQEDLFVEREPKSRDIAKEVKEKEERGSKKGLFGWLFKK